MTMLLHKLYTRHELHENNTALSTLGLRWYAGVESCHNGETTAAPPQHAGAS